MLTMAEREKHAPMWVFVVLLSIGLGGLAIMILDPFHMIPDEQAVALAGLFGTALAVLIGPGAARRL
jgi:hypothetical protein